MEVCLTSNLTDTLEWTSATGGPFPWQRLTSELLEREDQSPDGINHFHGRVSNNEPLFRIIFSTRDS